MKKIILLYVTILLCIYSTLSSQTYQLSGNPVNTTGWSLIPSGTVSGDFVRLTTDQVSQVGGIKLDTPINLKYCDKWRVEFDFRIDGAGTYAMGDGLAFWYLANPPTSYTNGSGLGIPPSSTGLMVGFDIYNNSTDGNMSKVHVLYGTNNTAGSNIEFNNTPGSTFHSPNLNGTQPFTGANYKHVEVTGEIDPNNIANWIIKIRINNTLIVNQSFQPSGAAVGMTQGYFGFSASTGAASARHSIKNVKIYTDKVPVLQSNIIKNYCPGNTSVDLTSFNSQLVANPSNYTFTYYIQGNSTPIANPNAFQLNSNTTILVVIKDTSSLLCDNADSTIQLNVTQVPTPTITSSSNTICYGGIVTLTSNQTTGNTWSTGATTPSITVTAPGTYTLTNTVGSCTGNPASIIISAENNPDVQISGNLILCDPASTQLIASSTGTGNTYTWSTGATGNSIAVSTPGTYTVTVKTPANCLYTKSVTVTQGSVPAVQNSSLSQCSNTPTAVFDLTSAQPNISTTANISFDYYVNQADAMAGNGNTIANPAAYSSGNAIIYVRVKSATCFKIAQLQLNITQSASPTITASSTTICYGGSVTLTSGSPTGNTWSTGATTPSITVTAPGTYTLTNTVGTCTGSPASITISAESNPDVQISGNLILCDPASTQLIASSTGTGNTYTWSTGATGNSIAVSTPGTYTVTVKTPANCLYTKSVTVTQGSVPAVQNSSLSQCSNTATAVFDLTSAQPNISTTANISFDYYVNQADAMAGNGNTIANPAAYSSGNAIIYVRVKSATCFKIAQLQLNITQSASPTITASSNTICYGGSVTLTSGSPTGNTWSTGATTPSITVTAPGTYTLTNTAGSCTGSPASITISAENNPDVQISGNLIFCQGSSTVLTASSQSAGNTYTWSNGVNGAINTVNAPGTYTVTATTPSGCQYQKSVTVAMDNAIIVNIAPPAQINCNNSQVTLNATASVYQPGATFLWTATGGGFIVSGANTLTPTVNNGGTYTLTITSATPSGCTGQASVTVIKNITPPTITVSAPKTSICLGESVILTASGAATYTWTGLTGNGNTQMVSPTATTTYTVTGTGANGCPAQTPATITIKVVPEIVSALRDIEICKGDKGILDAGTGPGYTYLWNTGATTPTINPELEGTYSVTISNGGCSKTFTAKVKYIAQPEILGIIYKENTLIITIKNNGSVPAEYSIDGGIIWQPSHIFTNVMRNTQYSIKVRNTNTSCVTTTTYYTFFMSNVITPNSDGKNDVINFSEISKYGNFQGSIFDKYGKAIFKISTKTPIWDGKYLGSPLSSDTYWYRLFWEDKITKRPVETSGWILLKNRD